MAKQIKTGIALTLEDRFSAAIRKAGAESAGFAGKTLGAVEQVDKMLSGTAAKLAAFGLSFSLGAVSKEIIELDHRMTRVGLTAGASAEQIARLKREIFKAAKAPDIKLDPAEIISAAESLMTKTGDLQFVEANIRNVGLAIQAAGESGGAIGDVFSEFQKAGYSAEQIARLMDDMVAQSDQGEFTFAEFAKNAKGVLSAYRAIGESPDDVKRANAAMQILTAGTKSAEVATTVLNSAINELLDPQKRKELEKLGIRVRGIDDPSKLRDFNDIMTDLAEASNDLIKADIINSLFGSETLKAVRAYNSAFGRNLEGLLELGDTAGKLAEKSATMAGTLKSNLTGLKTAFLEFADAGLAEPLAAITEALNELAAHPERVKRLFTQIAVGLGAIAAVKGIAGVARVIESMKGFKGGQVNITESLSMASAMPVYVTNWGGTGLGAGGGNLLTGTGIGGYPMPGGGTAGARPLPATAGGGLVDQYGRPVASQPAPQFQSKNGGRWRGRVKGAAKGAGGAALVSGVISAVGLVTELAAIEKNEELSKEEKAGARGGAAGETAGNVAGAALGAFAGSLIMPGVGTMIGGMIGSQLGGLAGRFGGEKLGVAIDKSERRLEIALEEYDNAVRATEAAIISGKTEEILAANYALIEAERRLESAKAEQKGHYEYVGVNSLPVWVEPEIPVNALPPQITAYRETQIAGPQWQPEAKLDGKVALIFTIKDDRTDISVKSDSPLFRPNIANTGNHQDAWELSP